MSATKTFVYVSCADDGEIAVLQMNPTSGDLKLTGKARAGQAVMPMAVSPDRRYLYAAIRSVPYSVASYAIDSATGELTHLSTVPLPDNMAYLATDRTGRFLFSASYAGHKISVNPIGPQGFALGDPVQVMITGRNAHCILADPSNRFVYVPNLASDQVMQLVFDEKTGLLTPNKPGAMYATCGAGPRHLAFAPNNRFVYLLNELEGTVYGYAADLQTGLLTQIQSVSMVPPGAGLIQGKPDVPLGGPPTAPAAPAQSGPQIRAADLHITPDGRFLYASERTTSTLAAFAVDTLTGKLAYVGHYETEEHPRSFSIDPRGNFLIAAGMLSGHCAVHRIDRATGALQRLKRCPVGQNPAWVESVVLS